MYQLTCQVLLRSMHSTSLYGLKLSVLRGVGAKALATDHRVWEHVKNDIAHIFHINVVIN